MDCGGCGSANESDAVFCESCGASLERSCGSCGASSKPTARFCRKCGQAFEAEAPPPQEIPSARDTDPSDRDPRSYTPQHLAEKILSSKGAIEGERKHVTVLFADVKSSMELAEQLDAEDWHDILSRFFEILTEGVHRFEGTVNQYTGDGIMALFGAPIAHEDHAHRACYTALYLQEELTAYTDRLRIERGLNFSVRIGLNSGEVVVGKIGDDLRMDYTAQGHTVGLAQRMESLAEPGKALLAGSTIEIVEGFFALRDLGETKVKGVEQLVRVAELEGVGAMRTRLDRSRARGLSKFVGRDEDMQRLESALERSLEGDGQVVGVVAAAGTGKSRLCFEFLERCRARNITIRSSTGVPHGHAVPLQPILEFYREIFGVVPEDSDAQARQKIAGTIAQIAPEEIESMPLLFDFMRVPDPATPVPPMDSDERNQALMGLIRRLTAGRSRREPAVLVFEDLHWLDPQTETVIEWIIDAAASTRTLFLVNFRPEFRADWMTRTHYQQIALSPLNATAAGELLAEWLGPDPSLSGFAQQIRDRAGGNPFFMEEVVQAQIESGALVGARGSFKLTREVDMVDIPASVHALLAARIDRLGEQTKRLLQTAAVIGDEMAEFLLGEVAELLFDSLRNHLRQLVQSEFLYEATLYPELGYAFKHPLTREVAYKSMLSERRREIHAAVAGKLEARAGEAAESQAPLLAHHWEEAGNNLKAARWQGVAGERHGSSNAAESLYHWGKVIDLLTASDDSPDTRALRGRARARIVYSASRSARSEEEVAELFAEAQRDLGDQDSRELSVALSSYAVVRNSAGYGKEAQSLADRGVEMARRIGDPSLLAYSMSCKCVASNPWDDPEQVCRNAEILEQICSEDSSLGSDYNGQRPLVVGGVMHVLGLAALGRIGEADTIHQQLASLCVESTDPLENTLTHWTAVAHNLDSGDVSAALEHGRQSLEWSMKSTNVLARSIGHWGRGIALHQAGRLDEALEHLDQSHQIGIASGVSRNFAPSIYATLFDVHLQLGDIEAARAAAADGLEISRALHSVRGEAELLACAAEVEIAARSEGFEEFAGSALDSAAELAADLTNLRIAPRVVRVRAELARARGDESMYAARMREAAAGYREAGQVWRADQLEAQISAPAG
jgi:class 3 adenylate cyclase/tetratricopeptide (TPR) repeat protein